MNPIDEHYAEQAALHGDSPESTMPERLIRQRETDLILRAVGQIADLDGYSNASLLDIGCGNGYTLGILRRHVRGLFLLGLEPCRELAALASKAVDHSGVYPESILDEPAKSALVAYQSDIVLSQRCLINLKDWPEQRQALDRIYALTKPGGFFIMLEAFESGLRNINVARAQLGLPPISPAWHNVYLPDYHFDLYMAAKGWVENPTVQTADGPTILRVDRHFLSTHSFVSRVIYPALMKPEVSCVPNADVVEYLCAVLPNVGEYSRIQARLFKKP